MKDLIKKIPLVGPMAHTIYRKWINPPKPFATSQDYWRERYIAGGTSGDGSYSKLAEFKAEVLNDFVRKENVRTVIEYGCGDGNQLKLAAYPSYIGFDVTPEAIALCQKAFADDATKVFKITGDYANEMADLTLSLDVIYHLVEDEVFHGYMQRLFDSAEKFVIIYSSNTNENPEEQPVAHVRHRKFSDWIENGEPGWRLLEHLPNRYPFHGDTKTGSFADFYIYKKV